MRPTIDRRGSPIFPQLDRPSLRMKLLYGFGSVAVGIKEHGFSTLLMVFYSQALGIPIERVGLAIMFALIVDSLCDPLIGYWTDHFRSRMGRRHPFMYAAAIPVTVSYYLLWNPPTGLSTDTGFLYLLVTAIAVRMSISFYEIPSSALVADLSHDYDQRTQLLSWRYFFLGLGGWSMALAAFGFFLRARNTAGLTPLDLTGYGFYGFTASMVMFAAILVSSFGTQRYAHSSVGDTPRRRLTITAVVRDISSTIDNRPFVLLGLSTLCSYIAAGIAGTISTYFRIYFWALGSNEMSLIVAGTGAAGLAALLLAPALARRLGKKQAAVLLGIVAIIVTPTLNLARIGGLLPPNGSNLLLVMLIVSSFVSTMVILSTAIIGTSMLADVVEYDAVRSDRHAAGLLFSVNALLSKAMTGVGVFGAGLILAAANFPARAVQGTVADDVLTRMALIETGVIAILQVAALLLIARYPITRQMHDENVRLLIARQAADTRPGAPRSTAAIAPTNACG